LLANAAPGEAPLALLLPGGAEFAAWFHAVALAGRPVLPLNTRLTPAELARQLVDARVTGLLGAAGDDRLEELVRKVPGLAATTAPDLATLPPTRAVLPGETCSDEATLAVMFTSG